MTWGQGEGGGRRRLGWEVPVLEQAGHFRKYNTKKTKPDPEPTDLRKDCYHVGVHGLNLFHHTDSSMYMRCFLCVCTQTLTYTRTYICAKRIVLSYIFLPSVGIAQEVGEDSVLLPHRRVSHFAILSTSRCSLCTHAHLASKEGKMEGGAEEGRREERKES